MRHTIRWAGFVVALVSIMGAAGISVTSAATVDVVTPGSTVAGKTIGQWTADWWNWTGSVPGNVFDDPSGTLATQNQSGPVFFLAGANGGSPAVTRSFSVPGDKYVLFPLINWVVAAGPDPGFASTAEEVEALVTGTVDPAKLLAKVDGIDVPNLAAHRERSPVDFIYTVVDGAGGFPPGTYADANADGYWVMLAPLGDEGEHTLRFGGTSVDFTGPDPALTVPSFTIDVTANVQGGGATPIPLPPAALSVIPLAAVFGLGYGQRAVRGWRSRQRAARR